MVTNQEEYEKLFLLTKKVVRFKNTIANETKPNWNLYNYLQSLGHDFENISSFEKVIQVLILSDILNCYFYNGYQHKYNSNLFMLFDMAEYSFYMGDIPWSYAEYRNLFCNQAVREFLSKGFDLSMNNTKAIRFPVLYIYLSEVNDHKAEVYITLLQDVAIEISKNSNGIINRNNEIIDTLLWNPQSFLENLYEDNEIETQKDETTYDNNDEKNDLNMELLKDKLFNGISLDIINDGYIKSKSYYSIIVRVTNHSDHKKKVQLKARYISIEEGLLNTYGSIDILGGSGTFLRPQSFVNVAMDFEKLKRLHNQDRIELDINEGSIASLLLIREREQWWIVESKERSTYNKNLKSKIEHFEAIEENFGIILQNFSVKVDDENSLKLWQLYIIRP